MPDQPTEELRDITAPTEFIPNPEPSALIWILLLLCIAAVTALVWPLLRRKKGTAKGDDNKQFFIAAKKQIEELKPQTSTLTVGEVATTLSLIIRDYITKVTKDPTLFETHEEFAYRNDSLECFPEKARELTKTFFDQLAISKYGPSRNQVSVSENLCDEASKLLHGLDSSQKKIIA